MRSSVPKALSDFEAAVAFSATSLRGLRQIRLNMEPGERAAVKELQDLSRDRVIIIKQTNKTGGLVIMPFESYDKEIKKMLAEKYMEGGREMLKYPETNKEKQKKGFKEIVEILGEGNQAGYVGNEDLAAIPDKIIPGRLYGQPKDHKPIILDTKIPPIWPVISCSGTIIEGSGQIGDYYLRPVDEAALSFIQGTTT